MFNRLTRIRVRETKEHRRLPLQGHGRCARGQAGVSTSHHQEEDTAEYVIYSASDLLLLLRGIGALRVDGGVHETGAHCRCQSSSLSEFEEA